MDSDKLWDIFFIVLISFVVGLITVAIISDKKVKGYYLSASTDDKTVVITRMVDWAVDDNIPLDRSVSYMDAIVLVDSLNKTLK